MRQSSLKSKLLVVALLVPLAGCVSFGGKAPPTMLVLTPESMVQGGTQQSGDAAQALVVLAPDTPRKIDTNRVPVQLDDSNIAYIKDAVWADKPARLMQSLLMEIIAAKTGKLVLNEIDAGGKATRFLSGSLLEFGIDESRHEAVIVYDAVKLERGQVVQKQRFEAREPVGEKIEARPSGEALNAAANKVADQIAAWVG